MRRGVGNVFEFEATFDYWTSMRDNFFGCVSEQLYATEKGWAD